ncbi:MAG: S9 family peptidase [Haliangiales bacterium]
MSHTRSNLLLGAVLAASMVGSIAASTAGCGAPTKPVDGARGAPQQVPHPTYDARAFHDTVSVTGASFSHDGSRVLFTSDQSGIYNLYSYALASGEVTALTASESNSLFALDYFPNDDRVLYSADQGGNELDHIYVQEPGGEARDLTPGERVKALYMGFSGDGAGFYIATNERDATSFDLYRYATDGYARVRVFENRGGYSLGAVSRDGRWLAVEKTVSNTESNIYLVDLATAAAAEDPALTPITPPAEMSQPVPAVHRVAAFSSDSARLYYTTDAHGEFLEAWSYDLNAALGDGAHRAEIEAGWDVSYVRFSAGGRYRIAAVNQDARTVLTLYDLKARAEVPLTELPRGDITGVAFTHDDTKMAFYVSSDRSPRNLYVLDLASSELKKLTDTHNPAIDPEVLVDGQVVRYQSFDGLEIPAILYRPRQSSAKRPVAALVWVHGGPGGQSRLGYRANIQYLVNHGYAVLAVNNRGSSGYGKTFFHLDDRKHGDVDLKDCVWARGYLASLDWVDDARIGIIGGSYGGYMVLAALAFEPEVFALGIDIFGVSNWLRTLASIPPWWGSFRDALYAEMGDPEVEEERLRRISPLFHADNIRRPLLVVQGANDPRVLKVESDEIVAAVEKNQVPVEYLVFPDEGHGFDKRENRVKASEAFLRFLKAHLAAP